jgi:hypothetical protein
VEQQRWDDLILILWGSQVDASAGTGHRQAALASASGRVGGQSPSLEGTGLERPRPGDDRARPLWPALMPARRGHGRAASSHPCGRRAGGQQQRCGRRAGGVAGVGRGGGQTGIGARMDKAHMD